MRTKNINLECNGHLQYLRGLFQNDKLLFIQSTLNTLKSLIYHFCIQYRRRNHFRNITCTKHVCLGIRVPRITKVIIL